MVTIKKTFNKYTQKEMRRESKWLTTKKISLPKKAAVMGKMRDKKRYNTKKTNNKIADIIPYTNYFKCKWIQLSKQKAKIGQMDNKQNPSLSLRVRPLI